MNNISVFFYRGVLIAISLAAVWLWWRDGMWHNGAMPTHGLVHVLGGCSLALVLSMARKYRRGCNDPRDG